MIVDPDKLDQIAAQERAAILKSLAKLTPAAAERELVSGRQWRREETTAILERIKAGAKPDLAKQNAEISRAVGQAKANAYAKGRADMAAEAKAAAKARPAPPVPEPATSLPSPLAEPQEMSLRGKLFLAAVIIGGGLLNIWLWFLR